MLLKQKTLPFRARFLFDISDGWGYRLAYGFQVLTVLFLVQNIIFMDNIGICAINDITLHFSKLSYQFEHVLDRCANDRIYDKNMHRIESKHRLYKLIDEHQHLISLSDYLNRTFRSMFFAQFIGSMAIICLTAFEATLTMNDPMIFFKFLIYMFAAFAQLLCWCWVGNKIFYQVRDL